MLPGGLARETPPPAAACAGADACIGGASSAASSSSAGLCALPTAGSASMAGGRCSPEEEYLGLYSQAWSDELVSQASAELVVEGVRLPAHKEVRCSALRARRRGGWAVRAHGS